MPDSEALRQAVAEALGSDPGPLRLSPVPGGDIHQALRARGENGEWFVKWNRRSALALFSAEADGLDRLADSNGPRTPRVLGCDHDEAHAWLILEFLALRPQGNAAALGASLAAMHRTVNAVHGWPTDNFIGHTPQHNETCAHWPEFWWTRRLVPQLDLAEAKGHAIPCDRATLRATCERLLQHAPEPALLHGDLWGGNHGYLDDGTPVIFDPAVSFGDRETDLAMMRLFGGFDPTVFAAYERSWPLPAGHEQRLPLYQLYHVLNHLNLFGSAWLERVESLLGRVTSETRHP